MDVGLQVLAARIKKGLKQTELAELVGTSQPAIARAERGGALQSLDLLLRIAEALGTGVIAPTFASLKLNESHRELRIESSSDTRFYPSVYDAPTMAPSAVSIS